MPQRARGAPSTYGVRHRCSRHCAGLESRVATLRTPGAAPQPSQGTSLLGMCCAVRPWREQDPRPRGRGEQRLRHQARTQATGVP